MTEHVSIVGGGIIGLTTGVFLELKGYDTRIYTKEVPYRDSGVHSLATNYAAASVMPVVIDIDDIGELIRVSNRFFAELEEKTDSVRRQDDFELYETNDWTEPEHADALMKFRTLEEYDGLVPSTEGNTHGYVHEIFFAEMPSYLPELLEAYRSLGGDIRRRKVKREEVEDLGGETVVNATGYGNLFDDNKVVARRGHLLNVSTETRIHDTEGKEFSYTYHTEDGEFVYAYPREDCLLLGGSNQKGDSIDGEWTGEQADDVVQTDGEPVPRRIVELNRELLRSNCGIDIKDYGMRGRYGYRPYREGGIRIEKERTTGKEVIHCYGHGGSGVTLSWYSANRVYNLLSGSSGFEYSTLDGLAL